MARKTFASSTRTEVPSGPTGPTYVLPYDLHSHACERNPEMVASFTALAS